MCIIHCVTSHSSSIAQSIHTSANCHMTYSILHYIYTHQRQFLNNVSINATVIQSLLILHAIVYLYSNQFTVSMTKLTLLKLQLCQSCTGCDKHSPHQIKSSGKIWLIIANGHYCCLLSQLMSHQQTTPLGGHGHWRSTNH